MADVDTNMDRIRSSLQQHPNEGETGHLPSGAQDHSASKLEVLPDLEKDETALSWIRTHESQYVHTVGAMPGSRQITSSLPPMGAGKSYPPDLPGQEEYVVEFDGANDPTHPQNWSMNVRLVSAKPI